MMQNYCYYKGFKIYIDETNERLFLKGYTEKIFTFKTIDDCKKFVDYILKHPKNGEEYYKKNYGR